MEEDLDKIKQQINDFAIKCGVRYIVFKTTETRLEEGKIVGTNVESEFNTTFDSRNSSTYRVYRG